MDKRLRGLVGKKFVNGGRNIATGLDCWGLVIEVYKRYGIAVPDFTIDAFAFQAIDMLTGEAAELRVWEEVHTPENKDAPLVVLMRMHPKYVTHAGVYIGENRIIHTMKMTGVITSLATALERVIAGYYRYVEDN